MSNYEYPEDFKARVTKFLGGNGYYGSAHEILRPDSSGSLSSILNDLSSTPIHRLGECSEDARDMHNAACRLRTTFISIVREWEEKTGVEAAPTLSL